MGHAKFLPSDKGLVVDVNGQQYTAKHVTIATGGFPIIPAVPGTVTPLSLQQNDASVTVSCSVCAGAELGITSDGFFELEDLPKSVLQRCYHCCH